MWSPLDGDGSVTSAEFAALVDRVSANSGAGAAGSVTSTELSAVSLAAQSALSTETSARIAADSALSTAISAVSQQLSLQVSALSQALSVETAARVSADNALSNAVSAVSAAYTSGHAGLSLRIDSVHSVLSQRLSAQSLGGHANTSIASPTSGQVIKYNSAAAQWVNSADATGGGGASVTSAEYLSLVNRVSANSGAGGAGSVTSTELSAVSLAAQSALSTETSARIAADSALSTAISAVSQQLSLQVSALSNALSAVSVRVTSVQSQLSTETSARIAADSALSTAISAVSQQLSLQISAMSQALSTQSLGEHPNVSIASPTSGQVLKYNSAAAQWVNSADATGGAGGSVTSTELSAVSAAAASAISGLSNRIDSVQSVLSDLVSQHNALSHDISVMSAGGLTRAGLRVLTASATISETAGANVPSMSASLTSGIYKVDVFAIFSLAGSAASGARFWLSLPALGSSPGALIGTRTSGAGTQGLAQGMFPVASTTMAVSVAAGVRNVVRYQGIVQISTAGTGQLVVAASAGGNIIFLGGSYFQVFRLV